MMQLLVRYKTKGELFQFYKVNEVAKFATSAVCAKNLPGLYHNNLFFFFWAATVVAEAKL